MRFHRKFHFIFTLLAALLLAAMPLGLLAADTPATAPETAPTTVPAGRLRVLVKPAEPFSFEKDGKITGFSVELWEKVAEEAGLKYDMKMVKTLPEVLNAVQKNQADVGVGAISVTQEREEILDFSHKFFDSGLQILASGQGSASAFSAFSALFRGDVLLVIGLFLLAIFIVSNILWFFERKTNPECFPEAYRAGVWEASWWAACTIISGGCENKAATSVFGRLVSVVWMLGGIGLTSYITATLASAMTVNTLNSDINSLTDLKGQTIATVAGSSTESYLKRQGYNPVSFENYKVAIEAVSKGKAKAVVYDSPMLRYYLATHADSNLQMAGDLFDKQGYSFALPMGSPYRKRINEVLLKLEGEGFQASLEKKWFNSKSE